MDAATIAAIAKQIVDEELLMNWKFYVAVVALTFIASGVFGFATSYFKARGEHLATKADFDQLLDQVRQTTEATESIKQSLFHNDWVAREFKTIRRTKLEELLHAVYETHHWLEQRHQEALFSGSAVINPDPENKIEVIGGLYFPELGAHLSALSLAFLGYRKWILAAQGKIAPAKLANDLKAQREALEEAVKGYEGAYQPLLKATLELQTRAKALMKEVLGVA